MGPTTTTSFSMTGKKSTGAVSLSSIKKSKKSSSLSSSRSLSESQDSSSEISETRATQKTKATQATGPTQEVQIENGGIFYDSKKIETLSKILPYMQGVTDGVFTVTLDLNNLLKRSKKTKHFLVSIEVLAVRQCLEK